MPNVVSLIFRSTQAAKDSPGCLSPCRTPLMNVLTNVPVQLLLPLILPHDQISRGSLAVCGERAANLRELQAHRAERA